MTNYPTSPESAPRWSQATLEALRAWCATTTDAKLTELARVLGRRTEPEFGGPLDPDALPLREVVLDALADRMSLYGDVREIVGI